MTPKQFAERRTYPLAETGEIEPASDPLLRETLAAEILTVTIKTLQAWRVAGKGPRFVKLGDGLRAPVRYRRSELERFLIECERGSTADHCSRSAA